MHYFSLGDRRNMKGWCRWLQGDCFLQKWINFKTLVQKLDSKLVARLSRGSVIKWEFSQTPGAPDISFLWVEGERLESSLVSPLEFELHRYPFFQRILGTVASVASAAVGQEYLEKFSTFLRDNPQVATVFGTTDNRLVDYIDDRLERLDILDGLQIDWID